MTSSGWDISLDTPGNQPDFGKKANPAERYELPDMHLNPQEEVLLKALKRAVANGWQGWRNFVNDAVTIGQEPEGVLRDMRRVQAPVEPLIFDISFAKALWGRLWAVNLTNMVTAEDRIKWLAEHVE